MGADFLKYEGGRSSESFCLGEVVVAAVAVVAAVVEIAAVVYAVITTMIFNILQPYF